MKWQSGMTLVELMVSLAIVLLVVVAATAAYLKILTSYKSQGAVSQNFMQNLTGFDLIRYDLQMAGYGLPASISGFNYTEATAPNTYTGYQPPYDPSGLNESSLGITGGPPHAFAVLNGAGAGAVGENTLSGNISAVLAIKSAVANINSASGHFGVLSTSGLDTSATNLVTGDHYILIDAAGVLQQGSAPGVWDNTFNSGAPPAALGSGLLGFLYGLNTSSIGAMPFNRADYFLDNQNLPSYCAPGTFELYRGYVNQTTPVNAGDPQVGQLVATPLIDCVEDFQVAFGIDPSGAGTSPILWQSDLTQTYIGLMDSSTLMTPPQLQQFLREVKIFILYQEGRGNVSTSTGIGSSGTISLGDTATATTGLTNNIHLNPLGGNTFTPGDPAVAATCPQCTQYRWRVKEIDVKPMNLHVNW
jgi:prepilin-type N-terminal cleavage/methylation domain-containing protein